MDIRSSYFGHALVIAVVLIASQVTAQDAPKDLDLKLELRPMAQIIAVYEPLRLCLSVKVTGTSFRGAFLLAPEIGYSGLVITGPAGEVRKLGREFVDPRNGPGHMAPPAWPVRYERGYTEGLDFWLCWDLKKAAAVFPTPGRYAIRAWMTLFTASTTQNDRAVNIQSDEISIDVIPSKSDFAQGLWSTPQPVGLLEYHKDVPQYQASRGPEDEYAAYAAYALALDPNRTLDERIARLKQALENRPREQLLDLVLLNLADLAMQRKDYALAEQSAQRVLELSSTPPWRKTQAQKVLEQAQWHTRPK